MPVSETPIYIPPNNWTTYVKNAIGTASPSTKNFQIGTDGAGVTNPAPNCKAANGLLFTASYSCGTDSTLKTLNLSNAWGKSAKFDCSNLFNKCSGLNLTLDDTGVLTLTDRDGNQLWQSTTPTTDSTNPPIAMPQYAANSNSPAINRHSNKSYLSSGEFLQVGEWIGSPTGKFRLEMVKTVRPPGSDQGVWVNVGQSYTIPASGALLRTSVDDVGKFYRVGDSIPTSPATTPLQLLATTASSTSTAPIPLIPPTTLQVSYNVIGCTDARSSQQNIAPINNKSATIYSIPSISTQNVGKIGYINSLGQLQPYPSDNSMTKYSSRFTNVGNYGVVGGDIGSPSVVSGTNACLTSCNSTPTCAAFVFDQVSSECQLKNASVLTGGKRYINNSRRYYVRTLDVNPDTSCPNEVETHDAATWNSMLSNMGSTMTPSTTCGLSKYTQAEREANATAFTNVNNSATSGVGGVIDSLINKYNILKDRLNNTKQSQEITFKDLQASKQGLDDWSGETLAQLEAINEDRELNMTSQYLKHNMYVYLFSGLAILLILIPVIKLGLSFLTKSSAATAAATTAAATTATTAATAATAT